jgi:hypothetical protein
MNATKSGQGPKYQIDIEGTLHPWDRDTITAGEIINLGGWSADQGVVEVNMQTQEERTLTPDEVVEVKPGHGFAKKVKFQRGRLGAD